MGVPAAFWPGPRIHYDYFIPEPVVCPRGVLPDPSDRIKGYPLTHAATHRAMTSPMVTWRSASMLILFVLTGSAVVLLLAAFVIAEVRDAIRERSPRGAQAGASTGRWRYEAVQHK